MKDQPDRANKALTYRSAVFNAADQKFDMVLCAYLTIIWASSRRDLILNGKPSQSVQIMRPRIVSEPHRLNQTTARVEAQFIRIRLWCSTLSMDQKISVGRIMASKEEVNGYDSTQGKYSGVDRAIFLHTDPHNDDWNGSWANKYNVRKMALHLRGNPIRVRRSNVKLESETCSCSGQGARAGGRLSSWLADSRTPRPMLLLGFDSILIKTDPIEEPFKRLLASEYVAAFYTFVITGH